MAHADKRNTFVAPDCDVALAPGEDARSEYSQPARWCTAPIRMLRLAQVLAVTGLGKTKIYELQAEGTFPMRVKLTAHSVGWVEEEVQAWLAERRGERATDRTVGST